MPLPKALKCGTIKGSISFLFLTINSFMYSNENKKDGQIRMKFEKVQFVYIDINYLEYLHGIEPEIFFDKNEPNYKLKPHLGILLN